MSVHTSLRPEVLSSVAARLAPVDDELARRYPGESADRQPVHTGYVPAGSYRRDTPARWGEAALELLAVHAPAPGEFAAAVGLPGSPSGLAEAVYDRVLDKLRREPVEDLRIDFEDGYGVRPDEEEDEAAISAARELGAAVAEGAAPTFAGIRIKSLERPSRERAIRTLDVFVTALLAAGPLPSGFVVTLPKVTMPEQVTAMADLCEALEEELGLDAGRLRFEVQIETPQAILGGEGLMTVPRLVANARGRCTGLHFGTYDYTAACGISAVYQSLDHPAADFAKEVMQVAAAGTGVRLADGSCNVLPVGDAAAVRAAWRLHFGLVRRGLERALYQGWDLHPGQLPSRYAAVFAFYREGWPEAAGRLRSYLEGAGGGRHQDEPATARALAGYFRRGLDCGALTDAEVAQSTGVGRDTLDRLTRFRFPE